MGAFLNTKAEIPGILGWSLPEKEENMTMWGKPPENWTGNGAASLFPGGFLFILPPDAD
ncbi:MAG TPA: hypothetical protein PKV75_10285 [Desulfobacterales bacterium]|nr:hypothetical protein [Desulfobacterales bacterium]